MTKTRKKNSMKNGKTNGKKKDEVSIHIENGEKGLMGKIHGLSAAFHPPKKDPDMRTEENKSMEDFVNGKVSKISVYWPARLGKLMLYTLTPFLESAGLKILREVRWTRWGEVPEAPTYELVNIGENKTAQVIKEGQLFVETNHGPMIFAASVDSDCDIRLTISYRSGCKEHKGHAKAYLDSFIEYAWANSPLRGKAWEANFSWINRTGVVDEPYLAESVKDKLLLHAHTYIKCLPRISEVGLNSSRGILLSGPPGCGKTMVIKSMIETYDEMTFIVMTSEHLQRQCVSMIYDIARRLSPAVVVLEDIDSAGGLSRKVASHPILGEVLQALNGVSENKGVLTIATTNYLEDLDDALRDRPGRFDVILTIGLPDSDARYPMLENLCKSHDVQITDKQLTQLVAKTKNFSGAWLAEIFESSKLVALSQGRENDLLWADIISAISDIHDRRQVAYAKTPTLPPPPSDESMKGDAYA